MSRRRLGLGPLAESCASMKPMPKLSADVAFRVGQLPASDRIRKERWPTRGGATTMRDTRKPFSSPCPYESKGAEF